MDQLPQVSIIIPTFNRENFVQDTLNSVKAQTFEDWECIIVDDGSTDGSALLIHSLIEKDQRFQYYKRPEIYPKGASSCRNYGFNLSNGKYIQWLDDDDLLSTNKLELQWLELENQKNSKIFSTCGWDLIWQGKQFQLKNFMKDQVSIDPKDFYQEISKQQAFVPLHAYLTPRELIRAAGEWNSRLSVNDDAEFFTRILLNADKLINTKGCHVLYREHEVGRISRKSDETALNSLMLSFRLIHSYLTAFGVEGKPYFKWKLLKAFYKYHDTYPAILREHKDFFLENGINLNWRIYYLIKHRIYGFLYPLYKNYL
ncbi:glycosyltransferase family 2 protein [Antarcticibacterium arcticum]|uniref:Glycosyltransferase family 2 protein n=1 Tax=Antarcticibacterium arcticum TaxID=2585771 RepID=A0A5B8YLS9_9FLAO|nr:glycosyltransferase family 2 protein [Antarcticibacterium arcticum]QED37757.1 glycosyltransferase family 2 protein [Antarcticibacterium arcticum]